MAKAKKLTQAETETAVEFVEAKSTAKKAEEAWKTAQPVLIAALKRIGVKSTTVTTDKLSIKLTLVEPEASTAIDPEKLKKKLGAKTWAKVTTRHLDMAKLEDAVARGLVDARDVALCSDELPPRSPHIRPTVTPNVKDA